MGYSMNVDSATANEESLRESPAGTTRRQLIRGTAGTALAVGGVGAASGSAAAQLFGGASGGGDASVISVDESGGLFGGGEWSADGSLPVVDELLVFCHGWFGNINVADQVGRLREALESGGFTPDQAVGIEWPAFNPDANAAAADTEDVGDTVASLAESFYDAGGGNIRLVGHSMGARCVFWTATKLSSGYQLETVASLGAAASGPELCGDPWNPGLDNVCELRNYYSNNDEVVGGEGPLDTRLGVEGANCDPGPNFVDVDVTASVGDHLAYLEDSMVGNDLADAFNAGPCEDAGGSGTAGPTGTGGQTGGIGETGSFTGGFSGGFTGGGDSGGVSSGFTDGGFTGGSGLFGGSGGGGLFGSWW